MLQCVISVEVRWQEWHATWQLPDTVTIDHAGKFLLQIFSPHYYLCFSCLKLFRCCRSFTSTSVLLACQLVTVVSFYLPGPTPVSWPPRHAGSGWLQSHCSAAPYTAAVLLQISQNTTAMLSLPGLGWYWALRKCVCSVWASSNIGHHWTGQCCCVTLPAHESQVLVPAHHTPIHVPDVRYISIPSHITVFIISTDSFL